MGYPFFFYNNTLSLCVSEQISPIVFTLVLLSYADHVRLCFFFFFIFAMFFFLSCFFLPFLFFFLNFRHVFFSFALCYSIFESKRCLEMKGDPLHRARFPFLLFLPEPDFLLLVLKNSLHETWGIRILHCLVY